MKEYLLFHEYKETSECCPFCSEHLFIKTQHYNHMIDEEMRVVCPLCNMEITLRGKRVSDLYNSLYKLIK